jgi:glutathione synthase/RimK-type ligase-like ATP-grasp enzyme
MPHFEETVAVALRAARSVPLGYLGVDLVIDETRGPLVLEINARPGLEIQNINGLCMGEAMTAKGSR